MVLPLGAGVVAPGEHRARQSAAGGELPFGLGGQFLARPGGVGVGVLRGHVGDRVAVKAAHGAARTRRAAPAGTGRVPPPLRDVPQVDRPAGGEEDQRAGAQQRRVRAGVLRRVEWPLRDRDVPGRRHEPAELGDGDRVIVDPEAVDLDAADRPLLRVEVVRTPSGSCRRAPRSCSWLAGVRPAARHRPRGGQGVTHRLLAHEHEGGLALEIVVRLAADVDRDPVDDAAGETGRAARPGSPG